jgi:lipopolysaccharide heptosyltransferase II
VNPAIKKFYLRARQALLRVFGLILGSGHDRTTDQPADIRKILFIRIDRIGDMVLSTPAIRSLKSRYPQARLTVLASPSNHALLPLDPDVDEILVFEPPSIRNSSKVLRLLRRLRRSGFDAVVDPLASHDLKTALIAFFTGAPLRVGFAGGGREVFFSSGMPAADPDRHVVDLTLDLVMRLGAAAPQRAPRIVLASPETARARAWLKNNNPEDRPVVGVHPGAYYPSQCWPTEYYAALATALQRDLRCRVVLIGGPADRVWIDQIRRSSGESLAVYQAADLRQAAALMSQLHVMVCNNSGPLHLAAAFDVPTVSFMGPTNAARWWPVGPMHRVLRVPDLNCLGCERGVCPRGTLECLRRIHPVAAVAEVIRLLEGNFLHKAAGEPAHA